MKPALFCLLNLCLALHLLSCSGGADGDAPVLRIESGWARAMPVVEPEDGSGINSAAYFRIRNEGRVSRRLLGGKTPVAGRVEVHESSLEGDVMRMRRLDGLDLPPGEVVELRPGGVHIMLIGLTESLVEGEELALTLEFENSSDLHVTLPVRTTGTGL